MPQFRLSCGTGRGSVCAGGQAQPFFLSFHFFLIQITFYPYRYLYSPHLAILGIKKKLPLEREGGDVVLRRLVSYLQTGGLWNGSGIHCHHLLPFLWFFPVCSSSNVHKLGGFTIICPIKGP